MIHRCVGNPEALTDRLLMALQTEDPDARQRVREEIGGCSRCWEGVACWALNLLAGAVVRG